MQTFECPKVYYVLSLSLTNLYNLLQKNGKKYSQVYAEILFRFKQKSNHAMFIHASFNTVRWKEHSRLFIVSYRAAEIERLANTNHTLPVCVSLIFVQV